MNQALNTLLEAMKWRYSVKKFDRSKIIPKTILTDLLTILNLTPSSFGLQPWKFLVITDKALKQQLLEHSYNQHQVVDASHLIVLCRFSHINEKDVDRYLQSMANQRNVTLDSLAGYRKSMVSALLNWSEEKKVTWMENQVFIALGNLLTACAVARIDACPMGGFSAPKYDEILSLKDKNLNSVVVCPIGYRTKDDKYESKEKVRYTLDETILYY